MRPKVNPSKASGNHEKQDNYLLLDWTVDPTQYSKAERTIIMVIKIIGALLLFPIAIFLVAAQSMPEENDSNTESSPPRKNDPFSDFSMSRNGFD